MKTFKLGKFFDFVGVFLSLACLIHCLLLPFVISFLPLFLGEMAENENVHTLLCFVILPVSLLAFLPGYMKHKQKKILWLMGIGLFLVIGAVFFGHDLLGESGEKAMTLLGGCFLILGHILNRSFCHSCPKCDDSKSQEGFIYSHF